jgi:hypothetical protein
MRRKENEEGLQEASKLTDIVLINDKIPKHLRTDDRVNLFLHSTSRHVCSRSRVSHLVFSCSITTVSTATGRGRRHRSGTRNSSAHTVPTAPGVRSGGLPRSPGSWAPRWLSMGRAASVSDASTSGGPTTPAPRSSPRATSPTAERANLQRLYVG